MASFPKQVSPEAHARMMARFFHNGDNESLYGALGRRRVDEERPIDMFAPLEQDLARWNRAIEKFDRRGADAVQSRQRALDAQGERVARAISSVRQELDALKSTDAWQSTRGVERRRDIDALFPPEVATVSAKGFPDDLTSGWLVESVVLDNLVRDRYTLGSALAFANAEEARAVADKLDTLLRAVAERRRVSSQLRDEYREAARKSLVLKGSAELAVAALNGASKKQASGGGSVSIEDQVRLGGFVAAYDEARKRALQRGSVALQAHVATNEAARAFLSYVQEQRARALSRARNVLLEEIDAQRQRLVNGDVDALQKRFNTMDNELNRLENALGQSVVLLQENARRSAVRLEEERRSFDEALVNLERHAEASRRRLWPAAFDNVEQAQREVAAVLEKEGIAPLDAPSRQAQTDLSRCAASGRTLTEYQRAVPLLLDDDSPIRGLLLLWDPGSGKTLAALATIAAHLRRKKPVFILVPTMKVGNQFESELLNELPHAFGIDVEKEARRGALRPGEYAFVAFDQKTGERLARVDMLRMALSRKRPARLSDDHLAVVDEAHLLFAPTTLPTEGQSQSTYWAERHTKEHIADLKAFNGKRLLLTATPAGKGGETAPDLVVKVLQLVHGQPDKSGGSAVDVAPASALREWFEFDASTGHWAWKAGAEDDFVRRFVRGGVSYMTLRHDAGVYPQLQVDCSPDASDRACVLRYDVDSKTVERVPTADLPALTAFQQRAKEERRYKFVVPIKVEVPLTREAEKRFVTGSGPWREVRACVSDRNKAVESACLDVLKGVHPHRNGKRATHRWTVGGGYDTYPEAKRTQNKALALLRELRARPYKHVVLNLNPRAPGNAVVEPVAAVLQRQGKFERVNITAAVARNGVDAWLTNHDKTRRFVVLRKGLTTTEQQFAMNLFNSAANAKGEYVQVLLADASAATGVDFKDAKTLHFLDPPTSATDKVQATGRILRRCALAQLARAGITDPTVTVITYVSTPFSDAIAVTPDEAWYEHLDRTTASPVDLMYESMRKASITDGLFGAYTSGMAENGDEVSRKRPRALSRDDVVVWSALDAAAGVPETPAARLGTVQEVQQFVRRFYRDEAPRAAQQLHRDKASENNTHQRALRLASDALLLMEFARALPASERTALRTQLASRAEHTAPGILEAHRQYARLFMEAERARADVLEATRDYKLELSNAERGLAATASRLFAPVD